MLTADRSIRAWSREASRSGTSRAHDGAAATKSFRIDIGVFLADARLRERTHDPAGETAGSGAGEGRCQPSGRDHGTDARNGHDAETSKKAGRAADGGANAGARSCPLCTVVLSVKIAVRVLASARTPRSIGVAVPPRYTPVRVSQYPGAP